jgi:hypothetical protein
VKPGDLFDALAGEHKNVRRMHDRIRSAGASASLRSTRRKASIFACGQSPRLASVRGHEAHSAVLVHATLQRVGSAAPEPTN